MERCQPVGFARLGQMGQPMVRNIAEQDVELAVFETRSNLTVEVPH